MDSLLALALANTFVGYYKYKEVDVNIEKSSNESLTSINSKPTFSGLYTNWNSFKPNTRKTNLVDTPVQRALKFCSKSKLQEKLYQIRSILQRNVYPEIVINSSIQNKISCFNLEPKKEPQKYPCTSNFLGLEKFPSNLKVK